MKYIKFEDPISLKHYIISDSRKKDIFMLLKLKNPKVIDTFSGSTLDGIKYIPLFNYDILDKTNSKNF